MEEGEWQHHHPGLPDCRQGETILELRELPTIISRSQDYQDHCERQQCCSVDYISTSVTSQAILMLCSHFEHKHHFRYILSPAHQKSSPSVTFQAVFNLMQSLCWPFPARNTIITMITTNNHDHDSQHARLVSTAVTTIASVGSGSTLPQWRTPEHGGY